MSTGFLVRDGSLMVMFGLLLGLVRALMLLLLGLERSMGVRWRGISRIAWNIRDMRTLVTIRLLNCMGFELGTMIVPVFTFICISGGASLRDRNGNLDNCDQYI